MVSLFQLGFDQLAHKESLRQLQLLWPSRMASFQLYFDQLARMEFFRHFELLWPFRMESFQLDFGQLAHKEFFWQLQLLWLSHMEFFQPSQLVRKEMVVSLGLVSLQVLLAHMLPGITRFG